MSYRARTAARQPSQLRTTVARSGRGRSSRSFDGVPTKTKPAIRSPASPSAAVTPGEYAAPAGQPVGDKAHRRRTRAQQRARRARRHFLLPARDGARLDRAAHHDDEARGFDREAPHRLDRDAPRLGRLVTVSGFEHVGERVAIVDDDETPRRELAVVGDPRRYCQQPVELAGRRAGIDHVARLPRTARGEQAERGRAVVEHGRALTGCRREGRARRALELPLAPAARPATVRAIQAPPPEPRTSSGSLMASVPRQRPRRRRHRPAVVRPPARPRPPVHHRGDGTFRLLRDAGAADALPRRPFSCSAIRPRRASMAASQRWSI